MNAILTYLGRNAGRVFQIGEALLKVVEAMATSLVELVPLTKSTKDDVIVNKLRGWIVPARKGLDTARDFFLRGTNG